MEYKIVKHVKVVSDIEKVESYYSKKNHARAVFLSWKNGDKELNGHEVVGIEWYEVDDEGKEHRIQAGFKAR